MTVKFFCSRSIYEMENRINAFLQTLSANGVKDIKLSEIKEGYTAMVIYY